METHTRLGWSSLIISVPDYILAFYLYIFGISDSDVDITILMACVFLTLFGFVIGMIARFGRGKDNFGIPGILSLFVVPLLMLSAL